MNLRESVRTQIVGRYRLHRVRFEPGGSVTPTAYEHETVVLVLAGGYDDGRARRSAGGMHFRPAGYPQSARVGSAGARLFGLCLPPTLSLRAGTVRIPAAHAAMLDLLAAYDREDEELDLEANCELLTAALRGVASTLESRPPRWLRRAYDRVRERTAANYSLSWLADDCGVHPAHLAREFKRHYGTTLGEFVRELCLGRAIDLLRDSDLAVGDVAIRAGFYDTSHLVRAMRRRYGVAPSEMRQSMRR